MTIKVIRSLSQDTKKRGTPAHALNLHSKTRAEWEQEVFDVAAYFTLSRRNGPGRFHTQRFTTLTDAMRAGLIRIDGVLQHDKTAMLYAAAEDGRSFCIPPKEWLKYVKQWIAKHGVENK